MSINQWPKNERPREKLLQHGVESLSDAELMAIFLRTGIPGKTAIDISRELLTEMGNLKKLFQKSPQFFYAKPGLGKAKYAMLLAALELGRRYLDEEFILGETLINSKATQRYLSNRLKNYAHEVFACLFLNAHNQILAFEELFHGSLTEASVYPREILKRCFNHNAAKIILTHNHPSGNPAPSQADKDLTLLLKNALVCFEIHVIDHVVIGHNATTSFAELGLL